MIWKRKCHRTRALLALWVGRDLHDDAQTTVRQHLAECPCCRRHWQGLQSGQWALEQSRSLPRETTGNTDSLWPVLHARMRSQQQNAMRPANWQRMNAWLPVGALAAACLAIVFAAQTSPPYNSDSFERTVQVTPVPDMQLHNAVFQRGGDSPLLHPPQRLPPDVRALLEWHRSRTPQDPDSLFHNLEDR
jgi:hypothetical protein